MSILFCFVCFLQLTGIVQDQVDSQPNLQQTLEVCDNTDTVLISDVLSFANTHSSYLHIVDMLDRFVSLKLHLTTSELWFGQEQEGILS